MNIKELKSDTLYKEYSMEIPYEEVDELINNKIKDLIPTVTLPGFRKGKAPHTIVKKKYETNVLSEVIESIVQDKTKKILEDKKIKPFRQPRVNLKKYEKEKPVEIEIKIDIEPEIKLKNFKDLELNTYEINLDKKSTDDNYNNFLSLQKKYIKIKNNRSLKKSDKVFVDITATDESLPDFLKKQNNVQVTTDSDYEILPNIGNKLIEKKVKIGDKVNLYFDLSKTLKSEDKKNVEFIIDVKSIEESVPFKLDQDFLSKVGLKDENELKENLKNNLKVQFNEGIKQIEKKQLMDLLESEYQFELPQGILDEEFHGIWHRLQHAKEENKLDEDDKNLSEKDLKIRYKKISERRVRLAILLQFIAKDEKINVSEKELTDGMMNYASQYPGQEKQILEYFKKNPSSIETIRGPLLESKVIETIFKKSSVNNKKLSVEDYKKLEETTFNLSKEKK